MRTGTIDIGRTPGLAPSPWRSLALVVTNAFSPPVLLAAGAALVAASHGPAALPAVGAYLLAAVGAPLLLLGWLLRRGVVSDPDIVRREQRLIPMGAAVAGLALGWELTGALDAPQALKVLAGAQFGLGLLLLAVTVALQWKISVHTAQAALTAALLTPAVEGDGILIGLVGITATTRLLLGRHTLAQTLAGAAAGLGVGLAFLRLVQGS